jgi:hypothetical protein
LSPLPLLLDLLAHLLDLLLIGLRRDLLRRRKAPSQKQRQTCAS